MYSSLANGNDQLVWHEWLGGLDSRLVEDNIKKAIKAKILLIVAPRRIQLVTTMYQ